MSEKETRRTEQGANKEEDKEDGPYTIDNKVMI